MLVCTPCQKKARLAAWLIEHPGKKLEYNRKWSALNPEKDRAMKDEWQKENRHVGAAKQGKARASKLKATPSWADDDVTKSIYRLARIYTDALGIRFTVDHIVPLNSKVVCGLHWHQNLQILEDSANRSKSNKLIENAP
jgi:hypothetical protein